MQLGTQQIAEDLIAVVILAGGRATRRPGKLEIDVGGLPLLVRVHRNVEAVGPVYVSASGALPGSIDRELTSPIVFDRWPRRGPLGGLYTTFEVIEAGRVFVVAGDAPFVNAATAAELALAWEAEIEAVVPENRSGRLEPLCALYDRSAFLREAYSVLHGGSGAVRSVVERLRYKRVRFSDQRVFANVNTTADEGLLNEA